MSGQSMSLEPIGGDDSFKCDRCGDTQPDHESHETHKLSHAASDQYYGRLNSLKNDAAKKGY